MAVPKRKHSQARRDKRRAGWKLHYNILTRCPQCSRSILSHHVCPYCGYYRGRQAIEIAKKEEHPRA